MDAKYAPEFEMISTIISDAVAVYDGAALTNYPEQEQSVIRELLTYTGFTEFLEGKRGTEINQNNIDIIIHVIRLISRNDAFQSKLTLAERIIGRMSDLVTAD